MLCRPRRQLMAIRPLPAEGNRDVVSYARLDASGAGRTAGQAGPFPAFVSVSWDYALCPPTSRSQLTPADSSCPII
jgi:hypothetical protein